MTFEADMGTSAFVRVIEQCCFNCVSKSFNAQAVNFISKPPKVMESRTYVKKPIWNTIETTIIPVSLCVFLKFNDRNQFYTNSVFWSKVRLAQICSDSITIKVLSFH